jgi:Polyketide cyclase / dehydrase and lipid transport
MAVMGQVVATAERVVRAPADAVRAALADYTTTRPAVLPEQYSEYRVDAGGQGAGTRVHWRLQATSKRVREQDVVVTDGPDGALVESDANSSMVTTWTVHPADADARASTVRARTTWNGAGGIGGFFERTFAPKGLARIHDALLERLERSVTAG